MKGLTFLVALVALLWQVESHADGRIVRRQEGVGKLTWSWRFTGGVVVGNDLIVGFAGWGLTGQ